MRLLCLLSVLVATRNILISKHTCKVAYHFQIDSTLFLNHRIFLWDVCWNNFQIESFYLQVLLLCGPPGLGKTTLAHVAARHCGYRVVEVWCFWHIIIIAFCLIILVALHSLNFFCSVSHISKIHLGMLCHSFLLAFWKSFLCHTSVVWWLARDNRLPEGPMAYRILAIAGT